ncbi:MAG: hypothetical protein A4S09_14075 [Proteobacteria bacterium SG_bin7]|nr:MAG: hypothetical protein A4S09_14075 [Proteobacteria bacterium SG_bin7]
MKNLFRIITLFAILLTFENASAQRRRSIESTPIQTTYASESSYGGGGGSSWALGFASVENLFRTNKTAFTGLYSWNEKMAVQAYFISYKDSGSEGNGFGGIFKYTFLGNQSVGLHGGGGLSFGKYSASLSFTHIIGDFGFHFTVHRSIVIHVDGGLTILNDDTAGGNKDSGTYISGGSSLFGMSMMYMF